VGPPRTKGVNLGEAVVIGASIQGVSSLEMSLISFFSMSHPGQTTGDEVEVGRGDDCGWKWVKGDC
jgi:hypothetical protein